jgi:general secretion pathway protein H
MGSSMSISNNKGFTLIELLVVIVLLGIITSLVVLSFGTSSIERQMEEEAKRLHALIRLTREESIIQAKEIALEISQQDYQFLEYKEKKWVPVTNKIFKKRTIPAQLELKLETDTELKLFNSETEEKPRLYFLSSGEQTPFKMKFNVKNKAGNYYQISGQFNGELTIEHVDEYDN